MKEKKLVIFFPSIEGGGVEKNLFIISNFLIKKIRKISLITISNSFKKKFSKQIKFISFKQKFWDKVGRRKKFFLSLFLLFIEILKDRNMLVLCFQGNVYCTLLCKLMGIKIIVRSNTAPDGWSQNIIKYYLFKYIFKFPDKIIVNSIEFKKRFKEKLNLKTICIYNPLNKEEIIEKSKIGKKIFFKRNFLNIINVGRFTDQKDQITLLKAINLIKDKIKIKLLLVGRGVEKKNLISFIKENSLSKIVKIIGFQNNPYNLIKNADLFVLSSIYEGLPNVVLEAITLKKFVISSSCPTGPKEILLNGKGGLLFKPGDYQKLANQILFFKKNKKKCMTKLQISYSKLHRFDFNKNLNLYLKLIKSEIY